MFTSRNYSSSETYDIAKFMDFDTDVYDVLNAPLLGKLLDLPVVKYYEVNKRCRDIDLIAIDAYSDCFMAFYIQYYNNYFLDTYPEGTVLKLFSLDDFTELCNTLMLGGRSED